MNFDCTSCLQIELSTFIISILDNDDYLPLIISSSIIAKNETSEQQCEASLDALQSGLNILSCWVEVYDKMYKSYDKVISDANYMNIGKLSHGGIIN